MMSATLLIIKYIWGEGNDRYNPRGYLKRWRRSQHGKRPVGRQESYDEPKCAGIDGGVGARARRYYLGRLQGSKPST